ncbi:MAG: hypothetical protein JW912_02195 [Sedimentisphaerales bacterium]|nr:hypothetical protein [Sedimentisphaerales bacterium]
MLAKLKKILVVIFLTLLIWTWAYMALEQVIVESGTLNISTATSPDLYVQFDREVPIRLKLEIKGPASKITDFRRRLQAKETDQDKERLDFFFNAEKQDMAKPGTYDLNVLQFLKESNQLKRLGLSVESCDIETIKVEVEELVEKTLPVQCLDESGEVIPHSSIEPARVRRFVRKDWNQESLKAYVTLSPTQIEQARMENSSVVETPYIEFSPGKRRYGSVRVEISLPSLEQQLSDQPLQPTIGFILSRSLYGKYKVELSNESELTSSTKFKATENAWNEYVKRTPYQVLVEVRDGDEAATSEITREVVYNFPPEYVQKKEIKLNEPPRKARFKLVPIAAGPTAQ